MLFSDYFRVDKDIIQNYGAVDISLYSDTPLFIDPILIYGNENSTIKLQYHEIVKYLVYLNERAKDPNITEQDKKYLFNFKEVKQNWLGLCRIGNNGNAIGAEFAEKLFRNISFVCDTNDVSDEIHIEKLFLIDEGIGKDRISDWAARMLLDFFVSYTEEFAKNYIDPTLCDVFAVDRCGFDYELNIFKTRKAYLPCIINSRGQKEFVLLTPSSILRKDEQEICLKNFESGFEVIFNTLSNEELRYQVNNLFKKSVSEYYSKKGDSMDTIYPAEIKEFKKKTYLKIIADYPVLYDYYVKHEEESIETTRVKASSELNLVLQTINENNIINSDLFGFDIETIEFKTAYEETLFRINYFKNQIECNGLWRNLYYDEKPVESEDYLQRLFSLSWCRTSYKFSPESNAGAGPVDFSISKGAFNSCIVEFKLASNPKLSHVYLQTNRYKISQQTEKSIIVIFYFNYKEREKALTVKNSADASKFDVVCIDCDKATKKSASNE